MVIFQPEIAIPASIIWLISFIGILVIRGERYEELRNNSIFYDLILPAILWIIFYFTILPAIIFVICVLAIFVSAGSSRSNMY